MARKTDKRQLQKSQEQEKELKQEASGENANETKKKTIDKWARVLLLIVLTAIILTVTFIVTMADDLLSNEPPEANEEDIAYWMELIEDHSFTVDKNSRDTGLMEFLFDPLRTLEIGDKRQEDDTLTCLFTTKNSLQVPGDITRGATTLLVDIGGTAMELWYSETEDGSHPSLTLKGSEGDVVVFLPDQDLSL